MASLRTDLLTVPLLRLQQFQFIRRIGQGIQEISDQDLQICKNTMYLIKAAMTSDITLNGYRGLPYALTNV